MSAPDLAAMHRDLRRRYWHPDNDGIPLPAKPAPYRPRKDWRARLDARISRCPGCDGLQWDDNCRECFPRETKGVDNLCTGGQEWGLTCDNRGTTETGPGVAANEPRSPRHEESPSMPYEPSYPSRAA